MIESATSLIMQKLQKEGVSVALRSRDDKLAYGWFQRNLNSNCEEPGSY